MHEETATYYAKTHSDPITPTVPNWGEASMYERTRRLRSEIKHLKAAVEDLRQTVQDLLFHSHNPQDGSVQVHILEHCDHEYAVIEDQDDIFF